MEIIITRRYHREGTNGVLTCNGITDPLCYTIELPWCNNRINVSCIPAGTYPVKERYSPKFGWHLHVQKVPGRTLILFHPANHALFELRGCIAPVTLLTGPGCGDDSRLAFEKLMRLAALSLRKGETLLLTIRPEPPGADTKPLYAKTPPVG